jgi:4-amino-4-deoxy-L-arabinose transferase-like glycosyltransferase
MGEVATVADAGSEGLGTKLARFMSSPAGIIAILALAVSLRLLQIGDWSIWEDEETSLYFSQNTGRHFPRFFPLFFLTLHALFQGTGVSILAGRLAAAAFGLASIALTFEFGRRFLSRPVALLAALLVALSLGHLFWSQSVRYYTLELVFQLLCMICFVHGFERGRWVSLLLANLALALALLTHFSAVLLVPVLVGYLGLMVLLREREAGYGLKGYLVFGVPLLVILALFALQFHEFRKVNQISPGELGEYPGQSPAGIVLRVAIYFGVPLVVLGLLAPLVARGVPRRIFLFLLVGSLVPILELMVIGQLKLAIITWYYAFFALPLFALLAGITLVSLHARGLRTVAVAAGLLTLAYDAVFLGAYYTQMYGDRPRWREAAATLQRVTPVRVGDAGNPEIYATVPGIIAHYLGVPPGKTMGHPLVSHVPPRPPTGELSREQWYIVETRILAPEWVAWLTRNGQEKGRFECRFGPFDRTVSVYQCRPEGAENPGSQ